MPAVIVGLIALAAGAVLVYLIHEAQGAAGVGLAVLRTAGMGALLALLINPACTRRIAGGPPTVLLDASLSMATAGGRWATALDTARALAGARGTVVRFGETMAPFDTAPPEAGGSRLAEPLTAARAFGRPVVIVTDGEIADAASLAPSLLAGVHVVRLPRDTVPDAALLDVTLPARVQTDDSIGVTVTLGTWGALAATAATLEIWTEGRRLATRDVALPPSPGTARRGVTLRPRTLPPGAHVLRFRLVTAGDQEERDDERWRVIEVSEQPAVVVVVDPADWEGRFLVRELSEIARTTVRGYARTGPATWRDMRTLRPVAERTVRDAAGAAGLLVVRGPRAGIGADRRGPVWRWPAHSDTLAEFFAGDWYVADELPPSPLTARLASVPWDSLPPLTGLVPIAPASDEWVALRARQGRRGAARPVIVGNATGAGRDLTTAGAGLWRWAFRGGAAREAYRALLASGVEWLLAAGRIPGSAGPLGASAVVPRGVPVVFRWAGDTVADSVVVTLRDGGEARSVTLRFDAQGSARVPLAPGVYRWSAAGAAGVAVVEPYSDEFPPATVAALRTDPDAGFVRVVRHARQRWWLYVVAVMALLGEWGWRQRRGLP